MRALRTVLLDTNVFSALFVQRRSSKLASAWLELLEGRPTAVSFQTREEVFAGAYKDGWGPARLGEMISTLEQIRRVEADPDVVDTSARLYAWGVRSGHPLHQPYHRADRWIAASAIAHGLELASMDAVFSGVDDLPLLRPEGTP